MFKGIKITVAIMCYGLYGYDYRTPTEMEGLISYFQDCAKYISSLYKRDRLSGVVFCGGFTNPKYPNVSEAGTSAKYLLSVLETIYKVPVEDIIICLEEQSKNTPQNIMFAGYFMTNKDSLAGREKAEAERSDPDLVEKMMSIKKDWHRLSRNVVFICDRCRWLKVWVMITQAKKLLPSGFILRVKSFPRKDFHLNSSFLKQWSLALLYYFNPSKFLDDLKMEEES